MGQVWDRRPESKTCIRQVVTDGVWPVYSSLMTADAPSAPLWRRVAIGLEQQLAGVESGRRLPSEAAIGRDFGVSRVTVRQALAELATRGLVRSRAGSGWFTDTEQVTEPAGCLQSFTATAQLGGFTASATVLQAEIRPCGWSEATLLQLIPGTEIFILHRLRHMDALPIASDLSHIPLAVLPNPLDSDWSSASLYEQLALSGHAPTSSVTQLRAINADPEQAHNLGVPTGAALLASSHTTYDSRGKPVETGGIAYRGDRYRYQAQVSRKRGGQSSFVSGTPNADLYDHHP